MIHEPYLVSPLTASAIDGLMLDNSDSGESSNSTILREAEDNLQFYLGIYGGLAAANTVSVEWTHMYM